MPLLGSGGGGATPRTWFRIQFKAPCSTGLPPSGAQIRLMTICAASLAKELAVWPGKMK